MEILFLLCILIILLIYVINVPFFLFQTQIINAKKKKKGSTLVYANLDLIELCTFSITFGCLFSLFTYSPYAKTPLTYCAYLLCETQRGRIFHSEPILIDMQKL